MDEKTTIKKKIQLKNQALRLIRIERDELRYRLNLMSFRDFLQRKIQRNFDPDLSRQIDATQFLLDSLGTLQEEVLSGRN